MRNETLGFNLVTFKCAMQIFECVLTIIHTNTHMHHFQDRSLDNRLKKLEEHILLLGAIFGSSQTPELHLQLTLNLCINMFIAPTRRSPGVSP